MPLTDKQKNMPICIMLMCVPQAKFSNLLHEEVTWLKRSSEILLLLFIGLFTSIAKYFSAIHYSCGC